MSKEKDYIGFDPVLWVERLLEINRGSQFTSEQKETIKTSLTELGEKLGKRRS